MNGPLECNEGAVVRGTFSLLVALAVVGVLQANAQFEPTRVYTGGEVIRDPESGLTLTIPAGWSGQLSPDGESFRLASDAPDAHTQELA